MKTDIEFIEETVGVRRGRVYVFRYRLLYTSSTSIIDICNHRYIILPFTMSTARRRDVSVGDKQWFPCSRSRNCAVIVIVISYTYFAWLSSFHLDSFSSYYVYCELCFCFLPHADISNDVPCVSTRSRYTYYLKMRKPWNEENKEKFC